MFFGVHALRLHCGDYIRDRKVYFVSTYYDDKPSHEMGLNWLLTAFLTTSAFSAAERDNVEAGRKLGVHF